MTASDVLTAFFVIVGALFCLVAAVGLIRMPDLYQRMQSATKAGTLGSACAVLGVALHFQNTAIAVEAVLVILFLFATAPIASHLIARAAFGIKVPLWDRTIRDDLSRDRSDPEATTLPAVEEPTPGSPPNPSESQ
jgi:multicomponent Na+:H+ antiporter subunit G